VVADSRAPRDGRFVERIGSYNPNTNPATITLDFDKALSWLDKGAKPSETVRSILRKEGVIYKRHLLKGVAKGAFTVEVAEERFNEWKTRNDAKVSSLVNKLTLDKQSKAKARIAAETKKNEERLAKLAEARAAEAKAEAKASEAEAEEKTVETEVEAKANEAKEEAKVDETEEKTSEAEETSAEAEPKEEK
jgi:small subunit ribosomal protein S16